MWMFGSVGGKRIRQALDTTSWERADEILRERDPGEVHVKITLRAAGERFLSDCRLRISKESTRKYELVVNELVGKMGSIEPRVISSDDLARIREAWGSGMFARKRIEKMRTFFRFCQERGWVKTNPASVLKVPKSKAQQVVPFSKEEMEKILWATEIYKDDPPGRRVQVHAFILVLRYTGLRIGDAVALKRESVDDGKLHLRTAKTGTDVWLPLKKDVIAALGVIKNRSDYFFWTGNGTLKSAVSSWHRSLVTLFKLAGVSGAHAHKFRHCFASELLVKGVPVTDVAMLLGHSSTRITEKHYAAWTSSRQKQLEESIKLTW
jgi:integrase/recombinase XerD